MSTRERPSGPRARVLYLHGLASSPRGRKVEALRRVFASEGIEIDAPDLNAPDFARLDFDAMTARAREASSARPPAAIAGSSLGALVALALAPGFPEVPLVLIAPALGFGRRWIEKLPPGDPLLFFHHGENREMPIHRRFFERMASLDVDRTPPAASVTIVMGREDESVERRDGRVVRPVVQVQAGVGRLAEHQRGAGGISQRGQARGLEQHPVRDRRLSRELLDLPAEVEKLGA